MKVKGKIKEVRFDYSVQWARYVEKAQKPKQANSTVMFRVLFLITPPFLYMFIQTVPAATYFVPLYLLSGAFPSHPPLPLHLLHRKDKMVLQKAFAPCKTIDDLLPRPFL